MAPLDLPGFLQSAAALAAQMQELIVGFEDLMNPHLTDADVQEIRALLDIYEHWLDVLGSVQNSVQRLQSLGYPTLPQPTVSAALRNKLITARAAEDKAFAVLMALPDAISGSLNFRAPISKE